MKISPRAISRCVTATLAGALLILGVGGMIQSLAAPAWASLRFHDGHRRADVNVKSDTWNLRLDVSLQRSSNPADERWFAYGPGVSRFSPHPLLLVPELRVSHPDPLDPDVFIRSRLPYPLAVLLGGLVILLRRRSRKAASRGFAPVQTPPVARA